MTKKIIIIFAVLLASVSAFAAIRLDEDVLYIKHPLKQEIAFAFKASCSLGCAVIGSIYLLNSYFAKSEAETEQFLKQKFPYHKMKNRNVYYEGKKWG